MKKEKSNNKQSNKKAGKGSLGGFDPDVYHISDRNVFRTVYEW